MKNAVHDKKNQQQSRINCFRCRHFFITHEPAYPYGCHAMEFKSVEVPSTTVFSSSGMKCQLFAAKKNKSIGN